MSLYTDSDVVTLSDLLALDSQIQQATAAAKPAITLTGSSSVAEMNWAECGNKILAAQQSYTSYAVQSGSSGFHAAAVNSTGIPARTQPRVRLNQIVTDGAYATAASPVKLWVTYNALALAYRDLASRMGKDRYQEKYERYEKEAARKWNDLRNNGLPFLYSPLEAPGAKHAFSAGTWGVANLSGTGSPTIASQPVQVAITYYDSSLYVSETNQGNAESGPSDILPYQIPENKYLSVDITSLNPPTGASDQIGFSQGVWTPMKATHWILWVGDSSGPLYKQAVTAIATKTVSLSAAPTFSGSQLGRGQYANQNMVFMNTVMRA